MDITLVTGNKNKLSEATRILRVPIRSADIDLDELQEVDVIKISDHKARQAWAQLKRPVVVWDTSVYIGCLNDFPGPLIKWFWKQVPAERVCQIATALNNRSIYNQTILTLFDGEVINHFMGRWDGTIPEQPRGNNGWDWDTIFIPKGHSKTYAEMDPSEVVKYRSHGLALEKLKNAISS